MKYANCHLHSTFSDAQFTPAQLVLIGKSLGYRALVLTDHETDGGVKRFMTAAKSEGILTMSGVEFYGVEDGLEIHLVALDYDMEDPGLRAFIKERCDLEMECTRKRVERGIRLGYIENFTWNDVLDYAEEGTWICIDTVMNAMKAKRVVPQNYNWTAFRQNVFKGPEAMSYAPEQPAAEQVIKTVRKAGGVVGIAHPNTRMHLVEQLVGYGMNGIEVSHPSFASTGMRTGARALEAAEKYNLYHCGGTDHTGPMSGCGGIHAIPVFSGITEEEYTTLQERRLG